MDKKKLKVILEVLSNVSVKYRGVARVFLKVSITFLKISAIMIDQRRNCLGFGFFIKSGIECFKHSLDR